MKELIQCPKCEHMAPHPNRICPKCGVVFEKLFNPSKIVADRLAKMAPPEPPPPSQAAIQEYQPEQDPSQQRKANLEARNRRAIRFVQISMVCIFLIALIADLKRPPAQKESSEAVWNSEYDASVYQVERYLKNTLNDPDSYQGIEWSKVIKRSDGTFWVRHKYRAKNAFGGYVVKNSVFILSPQGQVTSEATSPF